MHVVQKIETESALAKLANVKELQMKCPTVLQATVRHGAFGKMPQNVRLRAVGDLKKLFVNATMA